MVPLLDLEKRPSTPTDEATVRSAKLGRKHGERRFPKLLRCTILCLVILLYGTFRFNKSHTNDIVGPSLWDADSQRHHADETEKLFLCALSLLHI